MHARTAMKVGVAVAAAAWALNLAGAVAAAPRRTALLQLQRVSQGKVSPAFADPVENPAELNLQGFCKRSDCTGPTCEPVCREQPCCCWSTFAADAHPSYPSPEETRSKQECLFAPEGFMYAPEPGLTYDDGYMSALTKANLPKYEGRRLCCLRRAEGVQHESQRDLRYAVKTSSVAPVVTTTAQGVPDPGDVDPMFTTKIVTTSLMNPGDEFENAQMEEAARRHLAAANDLSSAVSSLNSSAVAIEEVHNKLQTDPNLVRSREHVGQMKNAIRAWAVRRWDNLKRLATGDASAFGDAPAPPKM